MNVLATKAEILEKMGQGTQAAALMKEAIENGTAIELHQYGRQILALKKVKEAQVVFESNYKKAPGYLAYLRGLDAGLLRLRRLEKRPGLRQSRPPASSR